MPHTIPNLEPSLVINGVVLGATGFAGLGLVTIVVGTGVGAAALPGGGATGEETTGGGMTVVGGITGYVCAGGVTGLTGGLIVTVDESSVVMV